ncbi:MAG TPA: hypothetical protein VF516_01085 [Kofleriaceae bacterium]
MAERVRRPPDLTARYHDDRTHLGLAKPRANVVIRDDKVVLKAKPR